MSDAVAGRAPHSPGDRVWGALWVVLGSASTVGALRMDRMEGQGVAWFGAPGLLPGLLGLVIALCGVLLVLRSLRAPAAGGGDADATDWKRVALTLALCVGFAAGLVGHGLPFGLAAGLYLFVHVALLQWRERRAAGQTLRGLAVALAVAVGAAFVVPFVFETLFLVRLP